MFECRKCKKRWNEEGYCKEGTFYTLCDKCGAEVLAEMKKEGKVALLAHVTAIIEENEKWKRDREKLDLLAPKNQ